MCKPFLTVNQKTMTFMKTVYIVLAMMIGSAPTFSQKYDIKGVVKDTLGQALVAATIMLLDKDSILIDYVQTDENGSFEFKAVREPSCLIKTSYLGYFPLTVKIEAKNKNVIDVGTLEMVEIAKELMEIVIKEAKAPLRLRGDTVEYDASQFKVPEGSTLEDLLRRLPGLEVGQEGDIVADGKGVTKLTVEGKTFFSDDPKFAIKNLPAEGVSKVQVFDKKSEETLLTGKASASDEKTMNIELKDSFKNGGFGKMTVGGGIASRGELKGNYNKFDAKNQISFVGVVNNTGRNGLSWDDFQDFMGSNAWNSTQNLEYGFRGSNFRVFQGDNESALESAVSNAFFNNTSGGFPTNIITGINYNYEHNKEKASARYFYRNIGNEKTVNADSRTFLNSFFLDNKQLTNEDRSNVNHRMESLYQYDFDSLLTGIIYLDGALVNTESSQKGDLVINRNANTLTSSSNFDNTSQLDGKLLNTSILIRRKFKKAGRSIGINGSYLRTDIDNIEKRFSDNNFFDDTGIKDSVALFRQFNTDNLGKYVIKANLMASEPLSARFFLQCFYNFSSRNEDGGRVVEEEKNENLVVNDFLSRIYSNTINRNRTGTSMTYAHKDLNVTVGSAYQSFTLQGKFQSTSPELFQGDINNRFSFWVPHLNVDLNVTRNTNLDLSYSVNPQEPTIENLLPVIDISNPLYIRQGNPELLPSINHSLSFWGNHSWPANGMRIFVNATYTYFEDQIVTSQLVDENLITTSKPINYTGGESFWSSTSFSFPIIRNKIKSRIGGNLSVSNSFAFVNDILNITKSDRWSGNLNLDITPSALTAIYLSVNFSNSNTTYNINTSQNQIIIRNNYNVDFNSKIYKTWYCNTNLRYSFLENERFGLNQHIPIINFSLYVQFLKNNRGELRISVYDLLNKTLLVNQSASVASVFDSRTTTLARYGLLSFSYNIKGMKSTVTRNDY